MGGETHSPLPWRRDMAFVVDGGGTIIAGAYIGPAAGLTRAKAEANAELIVRAVNSHAGLVAACEKALARAFSQAIFREPVGVGTGEAAGELLREIAALEAALAQAKVGS